jgi:hypothetical protein
LPPDFRENRRDETETTPYPAPTRKGASPDALGVASAAGGGVSTFAGVAGMMLPGTAGFIAGLASGVLAGGSGIVGFVAAIKSLRSKKKSDKSEE